MSELIQDRIDFMQIRATRIQ